MSHAPRLFVVGLTTVLILAGCTAGGASSPPVQSPSVLSSGASMSLDQQFIDMMVPHHESAVAMAEIALTRAEHAEIKNLAGAIISAQKGEITKLKDWRMAWFGSDQTPGMDAMPMLPGMDVGGMDMGGSMGSTTDMTKDIAALKTANPFDKAFIVAMTAHHQTAIAAARVAAAQATKPEIKALAGQIISAQQAEIDQMATWLAAWY